MKKKYDPRKFWNDRYQTFDITTSGHIDLPYYFNVWMYKLKIAKIKNALFKYIDKKRAKNIKLIELGCGTGVYINLWKKYDINELIGVDISSEAIDKLKIEYPEYNFYENDLSSDTMTKICGESSADVITAIGVLVHIVDDELFKKAVINISKIIKDDGIILITEYLCRGTHQDKTYMKIRSLSSYKKIFKDAGLDMIYQKPLYYFMGRPYDTQTKFSKYFLNHIYNLNRKLINRFPKTMGLVLYSIDRLITPFLTDGPSEEVLIFKKVKSI